MEHSDRENAKRAIAEVHKKYNAATAQPFVDPKSTDEDNSDVNIDLLGRAVGTRLDDDEEDVNSKAFFQNIYGLLLNLIKEYRYTKVNEVYNVWSVFCLTNQLSSLASQITGA